MPDFWDLLEQLADKLPDPEHLEFHYFEELSSRDLFASASYVTLAILGILVNLGALIVLMKNKNLSTTIKSYLFTDHLFRILSDLVLFYPAVCPFIRIADVNTAFVSYYWGQASEEETSARTYRPICVVWWWNSVWGADANQVFALAFTTIMHFLELLQFAISINRWLAVSFGGRYHHLLTTTTHLQVDLMLTATWIAFYKYSFGNKIYFDDLSFSLVSYEFRGYKELSGQLLKVIRILSVLITGLSILLDWSTFVLLKRHLERSRQLTQSDAKTGADIRLAKQLLVNHAYSIFVAACSCYMLIVFSPIDGMRLYGAEANAEVIRNEVLIKTSWFIFLATTFFPAVGNVVNGLMTIIFLSPPREKTRLTKSKSSEVSTVDTARKLK